MTNNNWEEELNRFISNWCPMASHLLDSDENDGERLREMFRYLLTKKDQEHKAELVKILLSLPREATGEVEPWATKEQQQSQEDWANGFNHCRKEVRAILDSHINKLSTE